VARQERDGGAVVTIIRGPGSGQRFWLGCCDVTIIGRHIDCDIALSHPTVSARHAEIRRIQDEFVLVDLGSLNGSYVHAQLVDTIQLSNDDEISIGVFRLVISELRRPIGERGSARAAT
jgi:pSer/pThr/pTyr-binding forkhead associated (FHA) protein